MNSHSQKPIVDQSFYNSFKISIQGNPLNIAKKISKQLLTYKAREVEMAAVGNAITNLLLTSSILSEYLEFLHRVNTFAFKPCEFCTA